MRRREMCQLRMAPPGVSFISSTSIAAASSDCWFRVSTWRSRSLAWLMSSLPSFSPHLALAIHNY